MKKMLPLTAVAAFTAAAIPNTQAATLMLTQGSVGRAIDNSGGSGNGSGNTTGSTMQAGAYNTGVDLVGVVSFQMSGLTAAEALTDITSASFSSAFNVNALNDTTEFGVTVKVIRTNSASNILASDFQTIDTTIMTDFDADATANGTSSLDATAELALGDWLKNNWSEDEYVFIGLAADNTTMSGSNNLYNYSNASLVVNTIPEPSSTALLGLGGLALLMRRRK